MVSPTDRPQLAGDVAAITVRWIAQLAIPAMSQDKAGAGLLACNGINAAFNALFDIVTGDKPEEVPDEGEHFPAPDES